LDSLLDVRQHLQIRCSDAIALYNVIVNLLLEPRYGHFEIQS